MFLFWFGTWMYDTISIKAEATHQPENDIDEISAIIADDSMPQRRCGANNATTSCRE